jgi:hypothetical protein
MDFITQDTATLATQPREQKKNCREFVVSSLAALVGF